MPKKTPSRRSPIDHTRRQSIARRRVGPGARCACGESRPAALVADAVPIVCQACLRVERGKSDVDAHHVAGRTNDPTTISIPTNDHVAILTVEQRDWPVGTFKNPDGDPLLKFAACIRGFVDTVRYLLERFLLGAARALEEASKFLTDSRGRFWWHGTPLEAFTR